MEVDSDDCNHKREYYCEICVLDFTTQRVSMHVAYLAFMLFSYFRRLRLICRGSLRVKVTVCTRMSCLVCNSSIAVFLLLLLLLFLVFAKSGKSYSYSKMASGNFLNDLLKQ